LTSKYAEENKQHKLSVRRKQKMRQLLTTSPIDVIKESQSELDETSVLHRDEADELEISKNRLSSNFV